MSIPLGTNDLKIYRRHASYCTIAPVTPILRKSQTPAGPHRRRTKSSMPANARSGAVAT